MADKQGYAIWYYFGGVEETGGKCNLWPFPFESMRVIIDDRVHDVIEDFLFGYKVYRDPETKEQYVYVHDVVYSALYIDWINTVPRLALKNERTNIDIMKH